MWLLGIRIWADIPTGVLGSLWFVSKYELRRRIRSTWVCRSSLFYLSHTRSCAVTPAGSNKSGGKPGLSCCCWGSNHLLIRIRDGILSFVTDAGLGVELAVLWIAFWGQEGDSIILTVPALLRIREIHLPMGWCRLLTCGLVGASVWRSSSWGMRGLWMIYLWKNPSFPDAARSSRPFVKRLALASAMNARDVDHEATAANSGHSANLLQVSLQEITVEAQMASLFGEDVPVAELLRQEGSMLASGRVDARASGPYFCPVSGCSRSAARDISGFASTATLRANVDLHMTGELSERPSDEWLTSQGLTACRCCGLSISYRIRDSTHPRCRDAAQSVRSVPVGEGSAVTDMHLPALHEIFLCNVLTKEYLPASLLPLAREEYGKIIARVLQYNRADAWNTVIDTDAQRKARRAWLEFFMFGKCVLRQSQRGRRPAQTYRFTESLLYRWRAGDRYGLWTEAMVASERRSRGRRREGRVDDVHREVERVVSLGRVGEATRRLVSPGLASETHAVKARLLTKFPARDEAEMVSASCVEPPEVPLETVYAAILSFRKGAGRGPTEFEGIFSVTCWDNDLMKNPLLNSFETWCSCWPMARRPNISAPSGEVDLWGLVRRMEVAI